MTNDPISFADDILEGAAAIAVYLKKSERQTYHLLETRQLPAFVMGGKWHMRKSRHQRHIEQLEAAAIEAA